MNLIKNLLILLVIFIFIGCDLNTPTSTEPSKPTYNGRSATSDPPPGSTVHKGDYVTVTLVLDYNLDGFAEAPVYAAMLCHMYARVPGTFLAGLAHPAGGYYSNPLPLRASRTTLVFEGILGEDFCYDVPSNDTINYLTLTFYEEGVDRPEHVPNLDYGPTIDLNWNVVE